MTKLVVALEDMSDDELRTLDAFLERSISEAEIEEDWREGDSNELLPLLRGLSQYIKTEFLGEDPVDYAHYNDRDDESDDSEFDF